MKPAKCTKVKSPCKICFQTVQPKNGLQCQGACKKWAHFKCLGYTPGKIQDIKAGLIKINCPCPDCDIDPDKKEVLTKPPFTCAKQQCPANKKPICEAPDCPKKLPPCPNDIDPESRSCPEDCPSNTSVNKKPPASCPPPCPPDPCSPPPPSCCPGKKCSSCCSPPDSAKKKKIPFSPPPCPPPPCPPDPCKPVCPPPPCPPPPCPPPPCPPPPCLPDPCKPACPPPKPPPPCPPPPCPPKPANCPFESCQHYLADLAARNKCTRSKCMVSMLEIPEQQDCIRASQSYIANIVGSHAAMIKPTRSDSELVTGKHDETKARIINAMDEMCHTVGMFHNQFKDLMGRMMVALEKC